VHQERAYITPNNAKCLEQAAVAQVHLDHDVVDGGEHELDLLRVLKAVKSAY